MKNFLVTIILVIFGISSSIIIYSNYKIDRDSTNKPIWSNKPRDLDRFVDNILDNDLDFDDLILLSDTRQSLKESDAPKGKVRVISDRESYIRTKAGYELPLYLDGQDNVFGVYTEFPSFIGVGQSWDSDLSAQIGQVIGDEKRGKNRFEDSNNVALIWSAIGDIRANPLSGRYDEGFAEDPLLASQLMNSLAENVIGDDGFYIKSALMSKHYAVYNSQWFRMPGSYNVSNRALHEYQLPIFLNAIQKGSIVGFMTSYGRTNGVPNAISPNMNFARSVSKYTPLFITDYGAPINMVAPFAQGSFSNGIDSSYVPDNEHMSALFAKAGSPKGIYNYLGAPGYPTKKQSISGIKSGLFNVSESDLKAAVRPILELYVRLGYFNPDNNGINQGKKWYPYNNIMNEMADNFKEEHKNVSYKAALSSIVLLKNSNSVLPIKSSSSLTICGPMANSRFKAVYSVKEKSNLVDSGLTPLQAIENGTKGRVTYKSSGRIIKLKSKSNNRYISSVNGHGVANSKNSQDGELFEVFAFGQNAYALRSLASGKWLGIYEGELRTDLYVNYFATYDSQMPERFRFELNQDDDSYCLIANSFSESFVESNAVSYYKNGQFIETTADGELILHPSNLKNRENSLVRNDNLRYFIEETSSPGENINLDSDYAIVVIGTPTRNSSGEGMDRSSLALGQDQYDLVKNVSKKYPGKTIVVLKANYPVIMEEIENNNDVAAILFQPYAGQYEGKALADTIFGNKYPSGRLVSTWYSSNDVFEEISEFSIPEGVNLSLDDIDPRIKFDYTNADPMESKLTYMYNNSDITYPFGYGLSYSKFELSDLNIDSKIDGNKNFLINLMVSNIGNYSTEDVVEVYIRNKNSNYGNFVPNKNLIGFKKVFLDAGQSKRVSINIDPKSFAKFDIKSQSMIVEEGSYDISVGHSATDKSALNKKVFVKGQKIKKIQLDDFTNIWEHAYASNKLIYKEVSKQRTSSYNGDYYSVMSMGSQSWVGIPMVDFNNKTIIQVKVGTLEEHELTFNINLDSPNGDKIAEFSVDNSGIREYKVPSLDDSGSNLKEVDYKIVSSDLTKSINGVHNLYITFNHPNIRLESIRLK